MIATAERPLRLVDFLTVGFTEASDSPSFAEGELLRLSKLHDEKYKPSASERKKNAEVSTPHALRREMLDKIPAEFWTTPKTVFEPCCGKGGFLIDIVDRFMTGLATYEPDIRLRHKLIVEQCLYFADINGVNIFIAQLLLGADGVVLNYYEGDTLLLNISEVFPKLANSKFDAVIGNPPYNKGGVRSHTGKMLSTTGEKNQTIWPDFVRLAFGMLADGGYLSFVHPLSWMKASHSTHNLFKSKKIVWILLWDNMKTKIEMGAEIPVSAYVIENVDRMRGLTTISSILMRRGLETISGVDLSLFDTIPLAYHSIFEKIAKFIKENNCMLKVYHDCVKINKAHDCVNLPAHYTIDDMYSVDTYRVSGGIMVRKTDTAHPMMNVRKLILANKASYAGAFIDDGRLGLCGNHKFYILGDNLETLQSFFAFNINKIVSHLTKYRQDFLEKDSFAFIPDVRTFNIPNMTEQDYYIMLGLTEGEISSIG